MSGLKKNVASQNITFVMVSATTGGADASATVSVHVTKDNGSQASGGGSVTNSGNGQYNYGPTQAETNASNVGFLFTATGDIPVNFNFYPEVVDSNGLPQVDVEYINAVATSSVTAINANIGTTQAITFDANNFPKVDVQDILGTTSAGAAGAVAIDWAHVENPTSTVALTNTTISSSSSPTAAQIATAVWQDTTSGDFTVSGSIGKSLSPATLGTAPGASGGLFIAGSNAATTVNITGNLSGSVGSVTNAVSITSNVKKDTALNGFMFTMTNSSTHQLQPGLTVTANRQIDGGSLISCTNAPSDIGGGIYAINLAAADLNGNNIMFIFTATGADERTIEITTQP